jgi:multicomponent Na+:H+ antiporter subunit G
MEAVTQIATIAAVATGTFFSVIGVVGYLRLPDIYTRLHVTGKVGIFGVVLLLVAAAIRAPVSWGHALVLIFFLILAGPAVGQAMGSAAHRIGVPRGQAQRDDLAAAGNGTTAED